MRVQVPLTTGEARFFMTTARQAHFAIMQIIAEGVATQEPRDFLDRHGCRRFQGYFFGTPVAAHEF